MDDRSHWLIDRIYAASVQPEVWQDVVEGFSEIFGGSPVVFGVLIPTDDPDHTRYATGIEPVAIREFFTRLLAETPWNNKHLLDRADRFGDLSEEFGYIEIGTLALYRDWMKPLGLAAIWPGGHSILGVDGRPVGGLTVFRKEGQGAFSEAEFGRADAFAPHLRRAVQIQQTLAEAVRHRLALAEAVDRLPTGVLLLDAQRRVVLQNQCASRILAEKDGLRVDASGLSATDSRDNVRLQQLIVDAMEAHGRPSGRGFATLKRPSGRREYALMVSPLLDAPEHGASSELVVAIFVVDPESGRTSTAEVLESLYDLTHSEAEIVRMLAQGLTLEEAAHARGVSMNTARSHLKHAFAKTGTARQSELLRLVIAGVGAIGD